MTDALAIADRPELLTPDWLTAALRAGGTLAEGAVVDAAVRPLGTGQMCDSVRVSLTFDGPTDAPTSLVAKLPAADETSRATALMMRNYEKEVRFYQELAPTLPMRTPRVHHADIDLTTAAFVLLLEDMAPAEQGDQIAGCTPEQAEVAVRELVGLHAPHWEDPEVLELEWLAAADPTAMVDMAMMMLPMLWQGFGERYADDLPAHVLEAGGVLFEHLETYLTPPTDARTIVHGDYRLDNLLLGPPGGPTPIAVVDWQTCMVGSGAADVAYFIGAGLLPEVRREVEVDLLHAYHDDLRAAGVADFGWDRCWDDYRKGAWSGLLMAVGASMMVVRTERGDRMFMAMADRHARHVMDLDAQQVLGA